MFSSLTVKTLRDLVKTYHKHHRIAKYYKMNKAELIRNLELYFIIVDGMLYTKPAEPVLPEPPKQKKRITPQLVTEPVPAVAKPSVPVEATPQFTGFKHLQKAIRNIENKQKHPVVQRFARRIRASPS
jgi:hypothetical protein